jgi:hypothetical protein
MSKNEKTSVRGDVAQDVHGRGKITQALVTEEMVEQRARELALIAGREPNRVTGSDRIQAKKELLGDVSADDPTDDDDIVPSGMGAPPTSTGKHTKNHLPTDDEDEARMVQEGVDEAAHDEMLEASKSQAQRNG